MQAKERVALTSTGSEGVVSMSELLAAGVAASAVSTPPVVPSASTGTPSPAPSEDHAEAA
ncbi:hypothetical protein [Streptomyces uncialis]|uniref:Uncharacterized protein n=1 Tax=Streptomyces uncialis TaxID=1048205 RepID=A0A1Q4V1Z5_9ACTN|nr:hypothetical protein [Streptomyces uncialis]OKH91847.1 hypothetical protein AB852_26665 [Streptomyces uncialis]